MSSPSPHVTRPAGGVPGIMLRVLAALLPALAAYCYFYGPAILISLALACATALAAEAALLKLRGYPLKPFLGDGSAVLSASLLALALPPLAPWWLVVVGTLFAMVFAKHLYGGLGQNLFNPAMVGFAVLMISFPAHMTHWLAPAGLAGETLSLGQQLAYIFGERLPDGMRLDAVTMATPLDTLKTQLALGRMVGEIRADAPIFAASGGYVLPGLYLLGGLFLLQQRIITWHIPVAFLAVLAATAALFQGVDAARYASPLFHLFSGAAMLGAFFIATDYVTSPTTPTGKLIFGASIGLLTYVIRVFGGYPDGVAFAVLIMNSAVPLIDAYTQPKVFGHKG
ncbi:MAG: RnfABCDGE type electron transport complex subunit D [Sulfuricella sp.]|nr:RnfABCDGE type electron transport complex subunit D [Sulfuricella sp.]